MASRAIPLEKAGNRHRHLGPNFDSEAATASTLNQVLRLVIGGVEIENLFDLVDVATLGCKHLLTASGEERRCTDLNRCIVRCTSNRQSKLLAEGPGPGGLKYLGGGPGGTPKE